MKTIVSTAAILFAALVVGTAKADTVRQHPIPCFTAAGWQVTGTDRHGTATSDGATATWVRTAMWFNGTWHWSKLYWVRASWTTLAQVQTIMFCTNQH